MSGTCVEPGPQCWSSPVVVRIAYLAGGNPFAVLNRKLGWGGSLDGRLGRDPAGKGTPC